MSNKDLKSNELTTLHQELINLIKNEFKTSDLETKKSLKRRELIKEYYRILINSKKLLTEEEYQLILTEYLENCCFKEFPKGKIAIISDTHLASKHENLEYLNQTKEFVKDNKI